MNAMTLVYGLLFLLSIQCVCGRIVSFNNNNLQTNTFYEEKEGVYVAAAPLANYFGEPYISFDLTFTVDVQPTLNYYHTEVLVLKKDQRSQIGIPWQDSTYYCCYNQMVDAGLCSSPGTVIRNNTAVVFSWVASWYNVSGYLANNYTMPTNNITHFTTLVNTLEVSAYIPLNDTDLYSVWAISCGEDQNAGDGDSIVNGPITMSNVYGLLPGELAPLEVLWWILFVSYLIWFIVWVRLVTRYNQKIHVVQHIITAVLFLSVLEHMLSAASYAAYNVTGVDIIGPAIFIFVVTTFKSTFSFVGLLLVTMGYAITRPKLPQHYKALVWAFGIIYFVIEFVYQCLDMIANTSQTQGLTIAPGAASFFGIALIIITFFFIGAIFFFLFRSLMELKDVRTGKKYNMFRYLGIVLGIAVLCSILIFIIELVATVSGQRDNWWRGWWLFTGYWDILHLFIIVPVSFLWRPNDDNKRYAYDETEALAPPQMVELETNPEG